MSIAHFRQLVAQENFSLLEASLWLAKNIVEPDLDFERWEIMIDSLAHEAADHIDEAGDTEAKILRLANWLFGPSGAKFRGDRQYYGDPKNSFLNNVLEQRLGIPITLSIVLLETAARLGIQLTGVGLPGHFVVGGYIHDNRPPLLIDPFNQGRQLTIEDCTQLIAQTTGYRGVFQKEWLEPTPPRMILVRVLNNLKIAFMRQENWPFTIAVFKHLQILQPWQPAHYRDEGLIHYHIKQFRQAVMVLEKYLELEPEPADLDLIRSMVDEHLADWVRLN